MINKSLMIACCAGMLLAACGGSDQPLPPVDQTPPAATSEVPGSASASVAGFMSYLQALLVAPADNLEPVNVSAVTPPTSDTTEPSPIK